MNDRSKGRPDLPIEILTGIVSSEEEFQNRVLRPIIKMKSDLLLAHLQQKLLTTKVDFKALSSAKNQQF